MVPLTPERDPMRPLNRRPQNRSNVARSFNSKTKRTKAANLNGLARGGWRL